MTTKTDRRIGRPRRKDFPERLSVNFTTEMRDTITRVAARFDMGVSQCIRESIAIGLPRLTERLKKRTQRKKSSDDAGLIDLN